MLAQVGIPSILPKVQRQPEVQRQLEHCQRHLSTPPRPLPMPYTAAKLSPARPTLSPGLRVTASDSPVRDDSSTFMGSPSPTSCAVASGQRAQRALEPLIYKAW